MAITTDESGPVTHGPRVGSTPEEVAEATRGSMDRYHILFDLAIGLRHPVRDADEILSNDDGTEVYFIHHAESGSINVNFSYDTAAECATTLSGASTIYEFDLFDGSDKRC